MGSGAYITGDIHGSLGIGRLAPDRWPEGQRLHRCDYLVICGDFGLVWSDPPSYESRYFLSWLDAQPYTTLFIDGNHENHSLLDAMHVSRWHGGKVHRLPGYEHIIHLMRGQVFDMGALGRWFTFGGARTRDVEWRREGDGWWARELPSEAECAEARANLEAVGWRVDYVFTHECPRARRRYAMPGWYCSKYDPPDICSTFLQEVDERIDRARLVRWYSGHYHDDLLLGDEQHVMLFGSVVRLGDALTTA